MGSLFQRSAGQLMHVTSLPALGGDEDHLRDEFGCFGWCDRWWDLDLGSGDLGPSSYAFVHFLRRSKQRWWQVLPIGPVGYGYSPYQSPSSFAGNGMLISPVMLVADGLLEEGEVREVAKGVSRGDRAEGDRVDFEQTQRGRTQLLRRAFERCRRAGAEFREGWDQHRHVHSDWLEEHCFYSALKVHHQEQAWTQWEEGLRHREASVLERWRERLREEMEYESFVQYVFDRQWRLLRRYASELGVRVMGDIPIFVSMDSVDVWANQHLFELDSRGEATVVAGVPPDYFSELGQRWGNPLYRWDAHRDEGYRWWKRRFARVLQWCDLVRIDHFRGFEAYYAIPAWSPDARVGEWRQGPGEEFFRSIAEGIGCREGDELPVVAEDLGFITESVHRLRDTFGFPGMRILQFGFGSGGAGSQDLPHRYPVHSVCYTGTHDNDTIAGWFASEAGQGSVRSVEEIEREKAFALRYLGCGPEEVVWEMLRAIWGSVACLAISPVQDLLGLGSSARMNTPGTVGGNWQWRCGEGMLTPRFADRLGEITETYERVVSSY